MAFEFTFRTLMRALAGVSTSVFLACQAGPAATQEFRQHVFGNALEALVITIDGPIKPGASARFLAWLEAEQPEALRIRLNSPGGSLIEGMRIGEIIRQRELRTEVGAVEIREGAAANLAEGYSGPVETPGDCVSACAYAFLGGIERDTGSAEKLGFHQFSGGVNLDSLVSKSAAETFTETMAGSQEIAGLIIGYIVSMGVDARVFTAAAGARPEDMRRFSEAEAIEYGIVTWEGFGPFRLLPEQDGLFVRSDRSGTPHPYDLATSVGFLCQREWPAKAWVLIETDMPGGNHAALLASAQGTDMIGQAQDGSWFNFAIPQAHMLSDAFGQNGSLRWFIALDEQQTDALRTASDLRFRIDVPRASGGYGTWNTLSDDDRAMIRSALLHCI